jgi:hypothetical protein
MYFAEKDFVTTLSPKSQLKGPIVTSMYESIIPPNVVSIGLKYLD